MRFHFLILIAFILVPLEISATALNKFVPARERLSELVGYKVDEKTGSDFDARIGAEVRERVGAGFTADHRHGTWKLYQRYFPMPKRTGGRYKAREAETAETVVPIGFVFKEARTFPASKSQAVAEPQGQAVGVSSQVNTSNAKTGVSTQVKTKPNTKPTSSTSSQVTANNITLLQPVPEDRTKPGPAGGLNSSNLKELKQVQRTLTAESKRAPAYYDLVQFSKEKSTDPKTGKFKRRTDIPPSYGGFKQMGRDFKDLGRKAKQGIKNAAELFKRKIYYPLSGRDPAYLNPPRPDGKPVKRSLIWKFDRFMHNLFRGRPQDTPKFDPEFVKSVDDGTYFQNLEKKRRKRKTDPQNTQLPQTKDYQSEQTEKQVNDMDRIHTDPFAQGGRLLSKSEIQEKPSVICDDLPSDFNDYVGEHESDTMYATVDPKNKKRLIVKYGDNSNYNLIKNMELFKILLFAGTYDTLDHEFRNRNFEHSPEGNYARRYGRKAKLSITTDTTFYSQEQVDTIIEVLTEIDEQFISLGHSFFDMSESKHPKISLSNSKAKLDASLSDVLLSLTTFGGDCTYRYEWMRYLSARFAFLYAIGQNREFLYSTLMLFGGSDDEDLSWYSEYGENEKNQVFRDFINKPGNEGLFDALNKMKKEEFKEFIYAVFHAEAGFTGKFLDRKRFDKEGEPSTYSLRLRYASNPDRECTASAVNSEPFIVATAAHCLDCVTGPEDIRIYFESETIDGKKKVIPVTFVPKNKENYISAQNWVSDEIVEESTGEKVASSCDKNGLSSLRTFENDSLVFLNFGEENNEAVRLVSKENAIKELNCEERELKNDSDSRYDTCVGGSICVPKMDYLKRKTWVKVQFTPSTNLPTASHIWTYPENVAVEPSSSDNFYNNEYKPGESGALVNFGGNSAIVSGIRYSKNRSTFQYSLINLASDTSRCKIANAKLTWGQSSIQTVGCDEVPPECRFSSGPNKSASNRSNSTTKKYHPDQKNL